MDSVKAADSCSLNMNRRFKRGQMGHDTLPMVPSGPNRHNRSYIRCPPKAEVARSNRAGCANFFNDLAYAQAAACCSMNSFSVRTPRTKKERQPRAADGVSAALVDVRV